MVQCKGMGDHAAIELAHNTCDDSGTDRLLEKVIATATPAPGSFTAEDCVDTSLVQPPMLRQEDRTALAATPILLTYQIAELPELCVTSPGLSQVSIPVFRPDSAESLARSIFLLI